MCFPAEVVFLLLFDDPAKHLRLLQSIMRFANDSGKMDALRDSCLLGGLTEYYL